MGVYMYEFIALTRECPAIEIPSGLHRTLPPGGRFRVAQFLGSGYTVVSDYGCMYRIDSRDADALGLTPPVVEDKPASDAPFSSEMVWNQLKTVYDPEIPVNVVDLGLIYSCEIKPHEKGGKQIDVNMSMTAPGCGMGNVLRADVENKLRGLPDVQEVNVHIVFDPPWTPALMSEAAKLQLGFDLDYGT
jgi:probable FeS assembly SUF system protein SufT